MPKVILTGGDGFIGSELSIMLSDAGYTVLMLVRGKCKNNYGKNIICKDIGNFCNISDWSVFLNDADYIIHLAAQTYSLSSNPLADLIKINCDVTLKLALDAANYGIKRFIFISSVGVLGSENINGVLFNNSSEFNPSSAYAVSKMKAEVGLKKLSKSTGMNIVVIRPPIVIGANVKGNFYRLLRLIDLGAPLPFGKLNNKRNMISKKNLCDLIIKTITVPLPRFSNLVVTDGSNWSVAELVVLISKYMNRKHLLIPIPMTVLTILSFLVGKKKELLKLASKIEIDGSITAKRLNWSPLQTPEDGLKETVEYYLSHKKY